MGVDDPHDNGAVQVDDEGYVYVFVSGRNTARMGLIYRSREPGSIDGFDLLSEQEVTYPQVWRHVDEGFFFLFTKYVKGKRGPSRELYWKTSGNGVDWSEDHKLAGFEGHYQVSGCSGRKVATFFNWHPESENNDRTNIYYAETVDFGKTWTTADGKALELPLDDPGNPALVVDYRAEGRVVFTCDLSFDEMGNPILLYVCSCDGNPGPQGYPREFRVTRWDGKKWHTHVISPTSHNFDMGSLYVEEGLWRVIVPSEGGPDPFGTGGEVVVWISRDQGESWTREQQVTEGSQYNNSHVRRPVGAKDPFYAFWADGETKEMSASRLYFCDSTGQSVCSLPYDMDEDLYQAVPRVDTAVEHP
tara:strand:- start:1634 stop:2713 length:1080 start_codon:yes stop_codon:yes gene_type:complete